MIPGSREQRRRERDKAEARSLWGAEQDPVELLGLGLWRAWVDAHGTHSNAAATVDEWDATLDIEDESIFDLWLDTGWWTADAGRWSQSRPVRREDRHAVARFRSTVLDDRARRRRPAGLARHLPATADPSLHEVLGPRPASDQGPKPIDLIIGYHDERTGEFVEGIAGLTPQQQRAYELQLDGHDLTAIRQFMTPARRGRHGWVLAESTVKDHLRLARRALKAAFGVATTAEEEPDEPEEPGASEAA